MAKLGPLVKIRLRNVLALVLDKPMLWSVQDIDQLLERRPELANCRQAITLACEALLSCFRSGNQVLLCGNGGSAADCEHIAGELVKRFSRPRPLDPLLAEKLGSDLASHLHGALPALRCRPWLALRLHSSMTTNPNTPLPNKSSPSANPVTCSAISTSETPKTPSMQPAAKALASGRLAYGSRRWAARFDLRNHDPSSRQRGSAGTGAPPPRLPHSLPSRGRHPFPLIMDLSEDLRANFLRTFHLWPRVGRFDFKSRRAAAYSRWQCEGLAHWGEPRRIGS